MEKTTGLSVKIMEMAARIAELRDIEGLTPSQMAQRTDLTVSQYLACERGESDLTFAFLYRCSLALNVDVTAIIDGKSPKLRSYTVTRQGEGQRIEQAHDLLYYNLASSFQHRIAEPLYVIADYKEENEGKDIELTSHEGQECDIVLTGTLIVQVGSHKEVLHPGDSIYYDSGTPHGMAAGTKEGCTFYAIVLNPSADLGQEKAPELLPIKQGEKGEEGLLYNNFITFMEDENGAPLSGTYHDIDNFNFAFDVVDALATEKPDKLIMTHVDKNKTVRHYTTSQMKRYSSQTANYFKSLGIKKGDRVMLVLKRHYQFWYSILALHKLGAVVIPATNQLLTKDFEYRFQKANIKAIICTTDGETLGQADAATASCPSVQIKVAVGGQVEGWHDFDSEFSLFSGKYERTEDAPGGDDPMLMFFTSGTTSYPKLAAHTFKYPLGHIMTAKYWHQVDPNGLHLTISDSGWAKCLWGKLYGQWLCEGATFVYDFDRFDAHDILPLFKEYGITTFCAPPTMYRMMIKENLGKYDLSSIKHASIAGEALNPEVFRQFENATGLQIMEGFGQSESTLMLGNLVGSPHKLGSMGRPVPTYDIDLVDMEGNPVPDGENGEIVVRVDKGIPCGLFYGYEGDEQKTKEVWHDGLYHTGDVAWRDEDGFYWYVGRTDDVIKSSGYRIGPFEIESVIMELPYVLECGVSAEPDDLRGQIVKASIVLVKGTEITDSLTKEVQTYVKSRTAPYKYPRIVVFRDELPKTISGKIQRNKL